MHLGNFYKTLRSVAPLPRGVFHRIIEKLSAKMPGAHAKQLVSFCGFLFPIVLKLLFFCLFESVFGLQRLVGQVGHVFF